MTLTHAPAILRALAEMARHSCPESGPDNERNATRARDHLCEHVQRAKVEMDALCAALDAEREARQRAEADVYQRVEEREEMRDQRNAAKARADAAEVKLSAMRDRAKTAEAALDALREAAMASMVCGCDGASGCPWTPLHRVLATVKR